MKHELKPTGWCFAITWCLATAPSFAADNFTQRDFADHFPLQLDGTTASSFSMPLPSTVYAASRRGDLGDIRVFNGAGDPVPFSLRTPRVPARIPPKLRQVNWFPLPLASAGGNNNATGVAISADGSLRATAAPPPRNQHDVDLIDPGRIARTAQVGALIVHLRDDNFQGRVTVEASDDLHRWQPAGDAQLLKVNYNGSTLSLNRIELSVAHARYLRLHWLDGSPYVDSMDIEIQAAATGSAQAADSQREWLEGIAARPGVRPGEYFFTTGGSYPVDRLRLNLPQTNTVAAAQVYSRPALDTPWREVASATLFRLHNGTVEQSNEPLKLEADTDHQWRVVVDTRNGGLGNGALTAAAGWRPATLIFVARGEPPFTLAVGRAEAVSTAVSRDALPLGDSSASGIARLITKPALPRPVSAQVTTGGSDASRGDLLWASLLLAVVSLGTIGWWMARVARSRASEVPGGLAGGAGTVSVASGDSAAAQTDGTSDVKG